MLVLNKIFKTAFKLLCNLLRLALSAVCLFVACSSCYYLGYGGGLADGYAGGYINGRDGIYAEKPSESLHRNFIDEITSSTRLCFSFIKDKYQDWRDKDEHNDDFHKYDWVVVEDGIDQKNIVEAHESLNTLPYKLVDRFIADGWTVSIVKDITLDYAGESDYHADGLMSPFTSTISIREDNINMNWTVAHEFGHYLDHISKSVSESKEWERCYKQEWEYFYIQHRNFHEVGTPGEYFAGCFAMYVESPETLKENCPISYDYINNLIQPYL